MRAGTGWVAGGAGDPILRKSKRNDPTMWDEIADMPGEIFDIEAWEIQSDLNSVPDEEVAQATTKP